LDQLQALKQLVFPEFAKPFAVRDLAKLSAFRVTWRNETTGVHFFQMMQSFQLSAQLTNANYKRFVLTNVKVRVQVGLDQIRMYD
jgi:hypothetical protein